MESLVLGEQAGSTELIEAALTAATPSEAVPNEAACAVLDDRVGILAAQLHALSAELVDTIAEFEALGGSQGYSSTAQWLSVRAGFTPGDARRLAGIARRRDELSALMGPARAGQLSTGVVAMAAGDVADLRCSGPEFVNNPTLLRGPVTLIPLGAVTGGFLG